jgi:hypothetical protein
LFSKTHKIKGTISKKKFFGIAQHRNSFNTSQSYGFKLPMKVSIFKNDLKIE